MIPRSVTASNEPGAQPSELQQIGSRLEGQIDWLRSRVDRLDDLGDRIFGAAPRPDGKGASVAVPNGSLEGLRQQPECGCRAARTARLSHPTKEFSHAR